MTERDQRSWKLASKRELLLDVLRIIGVLNVTPDSFSDGGQFQSVDAAVRHARTMIDEGACMIDVGGESTRPGARRIDVAEQIRRVVPVIGAISSELDVPISIDTTRSEVGAAALDAGAHAINDVSAGLEDDRMLALVSSRKCGLILMHRRVPPDQDRYSNQYDSSPEYANVVSQVRDFLIDRAEAAIEAGVDPESIVIDPGLGFGKSVEQNYELIAGIHELVATGFPVLSAASRKSFVGAVCGATNPQERVFGSTAISVANWLAGVRLFRVHDVAAHRQALQVAAAIGAATRPRQRVTMPE